MWVSSCQEKSKALPIFKKFKSCVEKERGYSLKILRTSHGDIFISNEFDSFHAKFGILRQLTSSYTPQKKYGVAERKKRSLVEMEESMI